MIKKVLLTGATGFIGSYITEILVEKNIDFLNISNVLGNYKYPDKTVLLPLYDKEGLEKTIKEYQPDAVIHMAAISSPAHKNVGEIYDVNVSGTENLLEAIKQTCKKGIRVLLFSSGTVYGNQKKKYFKETDPIKPVNHYSCSKAIMEYYSLNYTDCMDIRIVRPFNIIGVGQSEAFLVPKLVNAFKKELPEISLGNLKSVRDYVSIDFAANAVIEYLLDDTHNYPVLNICSGIGHTVQDVFDTLVKITGHKPEIKVSKEIVRNNEIWRLVGSAKRVKKIMKEKKPQDLESILLTMLSEGGKPYEKKSDTKKELSSVVVTRAENPDRLVELLKSLNNISDEVILLLDSADDNLKNQLSKYVTKICPIDEKGSYDAYYRNIIKNCTKDWILNINDEAKLSTNFTREIIDKYIINDDITLYRISRKWYISNNEYINTEPWYPNYSNALFQNINASNNILDTLLEKSNNIDEIHIKNIILMDSKEKRSNQSKFSESLFGRNVNDIHYCYEDKNYDISSKEIFNYPLLNNHIKAFVPKEMKSDLIYGIDVLIYINNYDILNLLKNTENVYISYHWFHEDKNVYLWDTIREKINVTTKYNLFSSKLRVTPPKEKGSYYFMADIVNDEGKRWLVESQLLSSDYILVRVE